MEPNKTTNQFNPNGNTPPSDMPAGDATASHINSSGAIFSPNPEAETANPSASLNANPNVGTNPTAPTNPMSSNPISANPASVAIPDLNYNANLGSNPTILSPTMAQANLPPKRNKKKIIIICASIVLGISLVAVIIFMLWLSFLRPGINLSELKDALVAKTDALFGLESAMEFSYTQATIDDYIGADLESAQQNIAQFQAYLAEIQELEAYLGQYERVIDDLGSNYDANQDFLGLKQTLANITPQYERFIDLASILVDSITSNNGTTLAESLEGYNLSNDLIEDIEIIDGYLSERKYYIDNLVANTCSTANPTPECATLLEQLESNNQVLSSNSDIIGQLYANFIGEINFEDANTNPISYVNRIINLGESSNEA